LMRKVDGSDPLHDVQKNVRVVLYCFGQGIGGCLRSSELTSEVDNVCRQSRWEIMHKAFAQGVRSRNDG
jgi:hypothetical protein